MSWPMLSGWIRSRKRWLRPSTTVAPAPRSAARCAASVGARLAGAPDRQVAALERYGMELGLAFQAVDDLLGIWGDPATTGKPAWSDLRQHKKTLPVAAALASAGPGADERDASVHRALPYSRTRASSNSGRRDAMGTLSASHRARSSRAQIVHASRSRGRKRRGICPAI